MFIDTTQVKANANLKKQVHKVIAKRILSDYIAWAKDIRPSPLIRKA